MQQQQQHGTHSSPMQSMYSSSAQQSFNAFPSQQQQYPALHSQMALPATGRLSSHDSTAPMSAFPQTGLSTVAYTSPMPVLAGAQQQQPQRFHNSSSPMPSTPYQQPHQQPHQQQQLQQHQQLQYQPQPQQQQQQQQQFSQQQQSGMQSNLQPNGVQQQQQQQQMVQQPGMQSNVHQGNIQPGMQQQQQPNLLFNQFGSMQGQQGQQHFNGQQQQQQQPQPNTVSYAQATSSTNFSPLRVNQQSQQQQPQQQQQSQQQPQQQQQQPHYSPPHDRQLSAGPTTSPHLQSQPQQQQQQQQLSHSQPPSSPHQSNAQSYMANFPPGQQLGAMHGLNGLNGTSGMNGMLQPQQSPLLPQLATPFFNGYLASATSTATLAAAAAVAGSQPVGAQLQLNYAQSVPVAMAPNNMPSAVVMASTASAPTTYAAVHHSRSKSARHHPLAATAAAVTTDPKGNAAEAESSSESSTPAAGSPTSKLAASPPKSKFPRPAAASHPPFQLLKTESKRPYATLLYTANKRMLPSFLAKKQALFGQEAPPPPPDSPDMVTIKVRVMALHMLSPPTLPPLHTLYFVAADISAIIHSRKSNIAKAVSSFPDDEKKRASVLCMQQNGTVSTHSLTVLSWKGVERLLNFSCAPVALPFLDWLRCEVHKIAAPHSLHSDASDGGKPPMKGDCAGAAISDKSMAYTNGASATDSTASSSAADSSEDEKLDSPPASLPVAPAISAHLLHEQQQAVA